MVKGYNLNDKRINLGTSYSHEEKIAVLLSVFFFVFFLRYEVSNNYSNLMTRIMSDSQNHVCSDSCLTLLEQVCYIKFLPESFAFIISLLNFHSNMW